MGNNEKTKKNIWLWILGWLFIFPVPLMILLSRKKEMNAKTRNNSIAAAWCVYCLIAIIGFHGSGSKTPQKSVSVNEKAAVTETVKKSTDKTGAVTGTAKKAKDKTGAVTETTKATSEAVSVSETEVFEAEEFEVFMNVSAEKDKDGVKFVIETNLPDDTSLMLTLSRGDYHDLDNSITASTKAAVSDGKAISNTLLGNGLSGGYDLRITMPLPSVQKDSVRRVIGDKGEFMTGQLVEKASIGDSNIIKSIFSFSSDDFSVTKTEDYTHTIFVEDDEEVNETDSPVTEAPVKSDVPAEYRNALSKAKAYSDRMNMSKAGIYDQLTSEYGEGFTSDAAQYAIDNLDADYNKNALKTAENYVKMNMSKKGIYEQLVSEYGEKFTDEEAQYAVDNLNADFNKAALAKAKSYMSIMAMSKDSIYEQLVSEYGEQFTADEAQYAIDNLD